MSRNYYGHEIGDILHGREIVNLGWDLKNNKAMFKLRCPVCDSIAVCVYQHTYKKCRLCFLNTKREKSYRRASL